MFCNLYCYNHKTISQHFQETKTI
uniref:Uncharacterized protein n=1 Tax=Anguilla anguilla TaxID=7936 RepID=A0A0E9S4M4_ANGAN